MEKMEISNTVTPTILVDCTPEKLRELATKLEQAAHNAMPGTSIICPFSRTISLHYKVNSSFKFVGSTYRDTHQLPEH